MLNKDELCETIRYNAVASLLFEVSATPKPGLVDRLNQGAHSDMDFFSFMASSAALSPYFYKCAEKGAQFSKTQSSRLEMLFESLRPLGLTAEKAMYQATGGANTHKGLIFSIGIICAAAAVCYLKDNGHEVDPEGICDTVSLMTQGICVRELDSLGKKNNLSHGEMIHIKYGARGIRGEVENGFPTVRNYALPVFNRLKEAGGCSFNDILVQTLLHIMAVNEDTNVLARQDRDTLEYVRNCARSAIDAGGILTQEGTRMVDAMDRDFIERNISPGGAADLLAVTIMLEMSCR
ncbi:MAG: triphosphoribosyl-dephospho-CoA synthase CitG [Clostridiaceae bacterium]